MLLQEGGENGLEPKETLHFCPHICMIDAPSVKTEESREVQNVARAQTGAGCVGRVRQGSVLGMRLNCKMQTMKPLIAFFAASILSCHAAALTDLEAISLIESGANDSAVGDAGEVSRYQILPKVWRQYTQSHEYRNSGLSFQIARRHLDNLMGSFQRATGRSPADFELYVLWNAGLDYYRKRGFQAQRVHHIIRERAERFVNLKHYLDTMRSTQQASLGY